VTRYNLYLNDVIQDRKVIARLAFVTGVDINVLRRELRNPYFMVLYEYPLSEAVRIRRELETMGLSLRLEKIETDNKERFPKHPLYKEAEDANDEDVVSPKNKKQYKTSRKKAVQRERPAVEIVLEDGTGFEELTAEDEAAEKQQKTSGLYQRINAHKKWIILAAVGLVLITVLAGMYFSQNRDKPRSPFMAEIIRELPRLEVRLMSLLSKKVPDKKLARLLFNDIERIERMASGSALQLSDKTLESFESMQSLKRTLQLRVASNQESKIVKAEPTKTSYKEQLAGYQSFPLDSSGFMAELSVELTNKLIPNSLQRLRRLEFLAKRTDVLRHDRDNELGRQVDDLLNDSYDGLAGVRARILAANLKFRSAVWIPKINPRLGYTAIPSGAKLLVKDRSGQDHKAVVQNGVITLVNRVSQVNPVSIRLAPLEEQPGFMQNILEKGLAVYKPAVFFKTMPGRSLPRHNKFASMAKAREKQPEDVLKSIFAESAIDADVEQTDNGLLGILPDLTPEAKAISAIKEFSQQYIGSRQWPRNLEIRIGGRVFSFTGSDLWLMATS
jgi:hypothetical protein